MDKDQHNYLLYKLIAADRNFANLSLRSINQDIMRVVARLVTELHDTQEELKELKKALNIAENPKTLD